jgi:hypothetical protein
MNDLELYLKLKRYIKEMCEIDLPENATDVYELLYFIKYFLMKDYLINFRALLRIYGIRFDNDNWYLHSRKILQFIHNIRKNNNF